MDKIPFNITSEVKDKKAFIRITGEIGWDTDAEVLRPVIDAAIQEGATSAHLYLFGPGGSCFQANEMVNILSVFKGNLTGEGGALVASAYTYIAQHCTSFIMPANGMFMVHPASGGVWGGVKAIEAYLKAIKDVEADYYNTYLEKSKNPELFKTNWDKGDWWMTATEALEQGFITGIKEKVIPDQETKAMIAACGCPTQMIPILNINNDMTEDYKPIANALDLEANASGDTIVQAITRLRSSLTQAKSDLTAVTEDRDNLKTKLDEIEKTEKEKKTTQAKLNIEKAIKDGRLSEDPEGNTMKFWLSSYESDYELADKNLNNLPKRKSVTSGLSDNKADAWTKRQQEIEEANKGK